MGTITFDVSCFCKLTLRIFVADRFILDGYCDGLRMDTLRAAMNDR